MTSSVVVRAGDMGSDRRLAIETFVRYLNPRYDEARFDWVYRQNPHGRGRLWVATDHGGRTVVGIAAAFPRRMCVAGRDEVAWVLGDFCVSDAYRSVGPALALQRACLAEVTTGGVRFCYDFPSSGMMAVYRRLGVRPLGQMVRLNRPLRVDSHLRKLVRSAALTRGLGAITGAMLAFHHRRRGGASGLEVALHDGAFGAEFTELYRRYTGHGTVMVERSAEYLNWRYRANPVHRHEVMTARRDGHLVGYAVFRQEETTAVLVDLFAVDGPAAIIDLAHSVAALARRRGLDALSVSLLGSSPWVQCLRAAGFTERETSPVVVYAVPEAASKVGDERAWLLLHGDRDS
jgi:hypothetical protein